MRNEFGLAENASNCVCRPVSGLWLKTLLELTVLAHTPSWIANGRTGKEGVDGEEKMYLHFFIFIFIYEILDKPVAFNYPMIQTPVD